MKTNFLKRLSLLVLGGAMALGVGAAVMSSRGVGEVKAEETVTYKQSSTNAASVTSGTAPTGSSVTFSNTYTTKDQLTKNNSMTYTLKGYAGYKITKLSMSMHSNKSAGTGKFSLVAGTTTLAEIASNTGFNQSAWYGNWTQSYVTVTPTMSNTNYSIKDGEDVVLTISASANSLFCESITITYDLAATLSSISLGGEFKNNQVLNGQWDPTGITVIANYEGGSNLNIPLSDLDSIKYSPETPNDITIKEVNVSVTYKGKSDSKDYDVTVEKISSITFDASVDIGDATKDGGEEGTIEKGGISLYCSKTINSNGSEYRFYSGSTVKINSNIGNFTKIEFFGNDTSKKISNMSKPDTTSGTLTTDSDSNKSTWVGSDDEVSFTMTNQGRANVVVVTLENTDPSVELDPSSATSVNLMKGNTDSSVKVLVKNIDNPSFNFTFDEDSEEGKSESIYVSVSASEIVEKVSVLTITGKLVGSTIINISVSGTICTSTIPVTIIQKPVSLFFDHSEIKDNRIELECDGSQKQIKFKAKDTDGEDISIDYTGITASSNNNDVVSLSGETSMALNPHNKGTAKVTCTITSTLEWDNPVQAILTVSVVNDYPIPHATNYLKGELVKSTYNAGDAFDPKGISIMARSRFGSTTLKEFTDLSIFTYTTSSDGVGKASTYYFNSNDVGANKTIYIFYNDDLIASISGITVNAKEVPLTGISFEEGEDADIARGDSFILTPVFEPSNTTDSRNLKWEIEQDSSGINIEEVDGKGVITVSKNAVVGNVGIVSATSTVHEDISASFMVNVIREAQKVTIRKEKPESWNLVSDASELAAGDEIVLAVKCLSEGSYKNKILVMSTLHELGGGSFDKYADVIEGNIDDTGKMLTPVEGVSFKFCKLKIGGSEDNWTLTDSNGQLGCKNVKSLAYGKELAATTWSFTIETISEVDYITVSSNGDGFGRLMFNYNNGSPRYLNYTSSTSSTMILPMVFKKSGGVEEKQLSVSDNLYNAVLDAESCFECSSSGFSFKEGKNWSSVETAFYEILSSSETQVEKDILRYGLSVDQHDKEGKETGLGNEVEHFLSRYDYIVGKYGKGAYKDFLERDPKTPSGVVNPLISLNNIQDTSWMFIAIGVLSLTALGGYFFIRKRKED